MSGSQKRVEQKVKEELVIVDSYAVAYPRTVMVHLHHALVAHRTVVSPRRLHLLALLTITEANEAALSYWKSLINLQLYLLPIFISRLHWCIIRLSYLPLLYRGGCGSRLSLYAFVRSKLLSSSTYVFIIKLIWRRIILVIIQAMIVLPISISIGFEIMGQSCCSDCD